MNEADPETIVYRAAEAELRKLCALRDGAIEELKAIESDQAEPAQMDSAALVAHALAGDTAGAAAVIRATIPGGRADYLRTLIGAVNGQIETHGFKLQRLLQAAQAADEPRIVAITKARARSDCAS